MADIEKTDTVYDDILKCKKLVNTVKFLIDKKVDVNLIIQEVINNLDYGIITETVLQKINIDLIVKNAIEQYLMTYNAPHFAAMCRDDHVGQVFGNLAQLPLDDLKVNTLGLTMSGDTILFNKQGIYEIHVTVNQEIGTANTKIAVIANHGQTQKQYDLCRNTYGHHGVFAVEIGSFCELKLCVIGQNPVTLSRNDYPIITITIKKIGELKPIITTEAENSDVKENDNN